MTEKLCHTAKKQEQFQKGRVSIVTPVYNGEKHLSQMLESVLHQTYGQIEMILVDDGSTDGTLELAESYRDKFAARGYEYHLIRAKHKNAAGAINGGLPYVTGEYLIWPDSDDVLKPESVERRVRFLQERPQYQCVRSQAEYFDISTGEILENREEKTGDLSKEDLFWDMLEIKTFVCCGCYMLRSDRFFEIYSDRHIPEYDVGQNFQMLLPFLYRHRCPTIQEVLYRVAVRPDSHSRRALSRAEEEKKYRDYEALVDEIAHICQIGEKVSKDRITCWKARRRFQIAVKYGQRKQAAVALWQLWRHGGIGMRQLLEYFIRWCMKSGRIVKGAYCLYRDCRLFLCQFLRYTDISRVLFCRKRAVALTFDDGYKYTDQILDKLKQYGVEASFFPNGEWMVKNLKICRQIVESGCEIGNHSYSHPNMTKVSKKEAWKEISRAQKLIGKVTDSQRIRLFRFPYGQRDKALMRLVAKRQFLSVSCSIDSEDWQGISAEEIYRNVMEKQGIKKGDIILLHTSGAHTVEALDLILLALKEQKYEVLSVSELLTASPLYRSMIASARI